MSGGELEQVEKNLVGSMENIQNNLAGTMFNVENNILSAVNNLNLSSGTGFPHGTYGWKLYRPGLVKTVAQLNIPFPDVNIGSDNLVYSKPRLNPDGGYIDPGCYQKYLGMKHNVAYWIGNGFITTTGEQGIPSSYADNPTGKILYGHVQYYNFNTLKHNWYGLTTLNQFYTLNTIEDVESSIANGDIVPWFELAIANIRDRLQSIGLDYIGDPFEFTYETIRTVKELNEGYLNVIKF